MCVTQETVTAILVDRMREAEQLRLVQQALRAEEEATGRGQRPVGGKGATPFGLFALSRRLQAFVRA